jgi:hypothetical protein
MLIQKDKMGGSLKYDELIESFGIELHKIKYFVESGTYKGTSTLMASDHFEHVYTMEIVPNLYKESCERATDAGVTNITFALGDSVKLLETIVPKVLSGAVFFLDGHQSGPDTSNNGKNVPLLEELEVILRHNLGPSLFILDDLRFWKGKEKQAWDWDFDTTVVLNKFIDHKYNIKAFFESNDRFWISTS